MNTSNKSVKFVHFNGTKSEWETRMSNPYAAGYENCIVFARVWFGRELELKIFAGVDEKGEPHIYDIVDYQLFKNMQNFLNVDANSMFTSNLMRAAIEQYLKWSYNQEGTMMNMVRKSIEWNNVQ